jgi:hypothetical protein
MRRVILAGLVLALAATAAPAVALTSGTEVFVPAGFRGAGSSGQWITTLYIQNPGADPATVTVYIYERDQQDTQPASSESFTVVPEATLVLEDVIWNTFALDSVECAFRVTSDTPVLVNAAILNVAGGVEFGQGFEGIPKQSTQGSGDVSFTVGLKNNSFYTTRIFMMETNGATATATLDLLDADGGVIATVQESLGIYEATLPTLSNLFPGNVNVEEATLRVSVGSGSLVVGASRVNQGSGDPLTLASSTNNTGGAATVDGVYQISIYDSALFAAGGNIVIEDNVVTEINGTYFNWDKLDAGEPACTLQFLWGLGLSSTPVGDFASGVSFSDSYTSTGSGVMDWTVTFTIDDNMSLSGTVAAVGSDFTEPDELGCNGTFPALTLSGGKVE